MRTYIVLGYGIPKKMETDDNYPRYLGIVFNTIFAQTQISNEPVTILFCGGLTDMFKPYNRIEAQEISRYFKSLADRDICRATTKRWKVLLEKKSLSTLENLVYTKQIVDTKHIDTSSLTIFCETTRLNRVKRLAKHIFGNAKVIDIDFDVSSNRYLDVKSLQQREQAAEALERWALESPDHFKEFRKLFIEKMNFLRKAGPEKHQEALRDWWKKELDRTSFKK